MIKLRIFNHFFEEVGTIEHVSARHLIYLGQNLERALGVYWRLDF